MLLIGIGVGGYFIPILLGYPRAGKHFAIFYNVCLVFLALQITFEDQMFTEADAMIPIGVQGISMADKYKLIENRTEYGVGDSYQTLHYRFWKEIKEG